MEFLDSLWHLGNFFVPAIGVGLLSATGAKWIWRSELAAVRWRRLAAWATTSAGLGLLAALVAFGRDGRMATYAAVTVASAGALWWAGFGPGRK